jgi:dethiobiotin synthetase
MAKGFFITGTDTGIGKTIIAGAIIRALEMLGINTCGMKPVESGCGREGDVLIPYDGMYLKQVARMDEPITQITPLRFESPLAPLAAAGIDKISIDTSEIKKAFKKLTKKYEAIIVEGVGGLLVPITKDYSVIELAKEFKLPLIVVVRPGLGTLNHTMLTVKYALSEGLKVAGVIINYSLPPEHSLAEETNPEILKQVCPVPVIGIFPHMKSTDEDVLGQAVHKNLNLELLRKYL